MILSLSVLYAYRMTHVYEAATPVHHFTAVQVDYPRVYRLHTYIQQCRLLWTCCGSADWRREVFRWMLNGRQTSVSHTYVRTAGMFGEGLERERCSK